MVRKSQANIIQDGKSLEDAAIAAMKLVRWIAENDSCKIKYSDHAKEQMLKRDLALRDVERVLKCGDCISVSSKNEKMRPEWGKDKGEVRIVITHKPKGAREVAIATIVVTSSKKVFIKTVMWKDER